FVNEGTDDNVVDRVDAMEVGIDRNKVPAAPMFAYMMTPLPRSGQPDRFYPDRAVELNYTDDRTADDLQIKLRKARVLTIQAVLPNGEPAEDVVCYGGQEPFE